MKYSGIILAGGKSSRLGFNKINIRAGGIPLIIGQIFKSGIFCDEVIISCSDENHPTILKELKRISEYSKIYSSKGKIKIPPIKTVLDNAVSGINENKKIGPIAGIYSGLLNAKNENCLVMAFDMPFISYKLMRFLVNKNNAGRKDAVIIRGPKGVETLCGIYSRKCIKIINKSIKDNIFKIIDFYPHLEVGWIDKVELNNNKIDGLNFFNINTSDDYEGFKSMWNEDAASGGTGPNGSGSTKKWQGFFYRGVDTGHPGKDTCPPVKK